MRNVLAWAISLWFGFLLASCGQTDPSSHLDAWWDKFTVDNRIMITSFDGVQISADLYQPKPNYFPGLRPVIIFGNSWTLNEKEYIVHARKFAEKGYFVLSYTTRGFGTSGGLVTAAGPDDVKDVSAMIDWLLENYPIDEHRIGMAGLSYGGGIGLLALALEPRLFTVTAMSSWSDLATSLYGSETVRKVWIDILILSGKLTGRIDPEFVEMYKNLQNNINIPETMTWASRRSALSFVKKINERNAPVFIANSYKDNLFPPNQSVDFFEKLTSPKKMIMSEGIHASAEIPGIFGLESSVWNDVHKWYDYWFMGIDTGILTEPPIVFNYDGKRSSYAELNQKNRLPVPLFPSSQSDENEGGYTITSAHDSGASTGIPIISSILASHTGINVKKWLPLVNKKYGMVYYSNPLEENVSLRGIPLLDLTVIPHDENLQLVAYLYKVDAFGIGTLMTHGVITKRNLVPNKEINIQIEGDAFAFDLKRNQKIGVVIDTYDPLYGRPTTESFSVTILQQERGLLSLKVPAVK